MGIDIVEVKNTVYCTKRDKAPGFVPLKGILQLKYYNRNLKAPCIPIKLMVWAALKSAMLPCAQPS